jgi:hypothetical protein
MKTDDVIERLARGVEPVAPLQRPWLRALMWLVGAVAYIGLLAMMMTSSSDATSTDLGLPVLLAQVAAIGVSAAAAAAAFVSVIPGASTRAIVWPVVVVAAWLGALLVGSLHEWQTLGTIDLGSRREWLCVTMIALGGTFPALGMVLMLRHGAPLTPRTTVALAVLAATGLANVGACVSHPHPSSATILVWHGATVLSLVAASALIGRTVLSWDRIRLLRGSARRR